MECSVHRDRHRRRPTLLTLLLGGGSFSYNSLPPPPSLPFCTCDTGRGFPLRREFPFWCSFGDGRGGDGRTGSQTVVRGTWTSGQIGKPHQPPPCSPQPHPPTLLFLPSRFLPHVAPEAGGPPTRVRVTDDGVRPPPLYRLTRRRSPEVLLSPPASSPPSSQLS